MHLIKKKQTNRITMIGMGCIGGIAVIWFGLLLAPYLKDGIPSLLENSAQIFQNPFSLNFEDPIWSLKVTSVLFLFFLLGVSAYSISVKGFRKGEEYGSAKIANTSQLARKYKDKEEENNLLITKKFKISLQTRTHQRNLNTVVVGGPGSAKTRGYVLPNLLQANSSFATLDPKGELLAAIGQYLKERGYDIRVINLYEPELSDGYNPFFYIKTDNDVLRLVENLWKSTEEKGSQKGDQFWDGSAKELLQAIIFLLHYECKEEDRNFDTALFLIRKIAIDEESQSTKSPVDILFEILEKRKPDHIALKYYQSFRKGSGKTLMSIQKVLLTRLEKFNLASVTKMTSTYADTLGLYEIPTKKTALFCITPVADVSFNFVISLLYTQLFEILFTFGNENRGALEIPIHFLLDEFANIFMPKEFIIWLSVMRSYRISASIILQDLSQLRARYKDEWQGVLGNCDSFLYLGGNERSTNEHISKMLGRETIFMNTFGETKGKSGSFSKNKQLTGREIMTPEEVRELDNNYAIYFLRGEPPIIDEKFDLTKHPKYKDSAYITGDYYTYKQPKLQVTADFNQGNRENETSDFERNQEEEEQSLESGNTLQTEGSSDRKTKIRNSIGMTMYRSKRKIKQNGSNPATATKQEAQQNTQEKVIAATVQKLTALSWAQLQVVDPNDYPNAKITCINMG